MVQRLLLVLCVFNGIHDIVTSTTLKPVCPAPPAQCQYIDSANDEHFYNVEGEHFIIKYAQTYLTLKCPDGIALESASLPRFEELVRVQEVYVVQCDLPKESYAAAFAALNVSAVYKLELRNPRAPASGSLRQAHLRGLDVAVLFVKSRAPVPLAPTALATLAELIDLRLEGVPLDEAALLALPPSLIRLSLTDSNISAVPEEALRRLPALQHLYLRERSLSQTPELGAAPALQDALLSAPVQRLPTPDGLRALWLGGARGVARRGGCAALRRLTLFGGTASALPPAWLLGCSNLTMLSLNSLPLNESLPPDLLHFTSQLTHLTVSRCHLTSLPPDLLLKSKKLVSLDLSHNRLEELPRDWFVSVRGLRVLNLTDNRLTRQSAAAAFALPPLQVLKLSYNPLGDLCDAPVTNDSTYVGNALSELSAMTSLETLELAHCGVTRVCGDWREGLRSLRRLELSRNGVAELGAQELRWRRDAPAEVLLLGNPIERLLLTQEDYEDALKAPVPQHSVTLKMDATVRCECAYWAARLARSGRGAVLGGVRCRGGAALGALRPEALRCPVPASACAHGCSCSVLGALFEVSCEGAGLPGPPAAPAAAPPAARLLLANNAVAALRPRDFPDTLTFLNLSGNLVEEVDAETAAAMFAKSERRVALEGNPLRCECGAVLVAALAAHRAQVADFERLRCGGRGGRGGRVAELDMAALCAEGEGRRAWGGWGAWGAAGGALAMALVGVVLAVRAGRQALLRRAKAALLARGLCLRWLLPDAPATEVAEALPYDVFVSFSHHDHAFVAERLVPGLEGGPRPYRLCLHYRDWAPGDWIPLQIARSVRQAHATLLLVSEQWARSQWAQLEFREAYARALEGEGPRLVVVLLGEAEAALAQLPELAPFLRRNTYLRADDPWFWRKLRRALPRGPTPDPDAPLHTAPSA